jgi:hypothetical protein
MERRLVMFQHRTVRFGTGNRQLEPLLKQPRALATALIMGAGLTLGLPASDAKAQAEELDDASIIWETNATDCDVGIQIFLDGEGWRKVNVKDPNFLTIYEAFARGGLRQQGLTEHFMESEEPVIDELAALDPDCDEGEASFDDLFDRFPEGTYRFRGRTVENDVIKGKDELTYDLPAAPDVTAPAEDAVVDSTMDLTVRWDEVTDSLDGLPPGTAGPITIIRYQVIVEQDNDDLDNPKVFTVDRRAGSRAAVVPASFLAAGQDYKVEVLAVEKSGNQTITEVPFSTAP